MENLHHLFWLFSIPITIYFTLLVLFIKYQKTTYNITVVVCNVLNKEVIDRYNINVTSRFVSYAQKRAKVQIKRNQMKTYMEIHSIDSTNPVLF